MADANRKPRIEKLNAMTLAGLQRHYDSKTMNDIPKLWTELGPYFGKIPGAVSNVAYGVISDMRRDADGFDYLAGVEVEGRDRLKGFVTYEVPANTCAVFDHNEHISKIRDTIMKALDVWLPASGKKRRAPMSGGLEYLERYDEDYDPKNPVGHTSLWFPIEA